MLTSAGVDERRPKESLRDRAYAALRAQILTGAIRPNSLLVEPELAQSLSMSKTPVREALALLVNDGLVQVLPRRGYIVANLSADDIREIANLRLMLEPEVARLAARLGTQEELDGLTELLGSESFDLNSEQFLISNVAFHGGIARITGNSRLVAIVNKLAEDMQFVLGQIKQEPGSAVDIHHGHRAIVDALRARDGDRAAALMEEHLSHAARIALSLR